MSTTKRGKTGGKIVGSQQFALPGRFVDEDNTLVSGRSFDLGGFLPVLRVDFDSEVGRKAYQTRGSNFPIVQIDHIYLRKEISRARSGRNRN